MKVSLIECVRDPDDIVWTAARTCYSSKSPIDLFKKTYSSHKPNTADLIKKLLDSGHMSPFEHVNFTFAIEGISRSCSHQLVRHRIASYSQQSQRYVSESHMKYIIPGTIVGDPSTYEIYDDAIMHCERAYNALVEAGVPAEDARYLLPNAAQTNIVMTMNARELLHFFNQRCCRRAQWEIRELANKMLALCKEVSPVIFENAGAPCVSGECKEGCCCGKES